jgi:hypothetical protein
MVKPMSNPDTPLFQTPDEKQRLSFDLMKRLLSTIDQWGKAQGRKSAEQMSEVAMDALLQTVTAICVHREISAMGESPASAQAFFRRIYKGEGRIKPEESESLLTLQARKDVLFDNLVRAIHAFYR